MSLDVLFVVAMASIWLLLLYGMLLTVGGARHAMESERQSRIGIPTEVEWPMLTVLIPAHNEERVIGKTLLAFTKLDYPRDRLQVIVINDSSKDRTGEIIDEIAARYEMFTPFHIQPPEGAKGKSHALNLAVRQAKGDFIAVYDADNRPEPTAFKQHVYALMNDKKAGAVVGKFRIINAQTNWLTRFIHIETIAHQWMVQGGRWHWFKLCTIPGTNFVIRRSLLEQLGGWDVEALAEDTEITIRIYEAGYHIRFNPLAVTWQQEPDDFKIWLKQRTRWARGNQYVLFKNMLNIRKMKSKAIILDMIYYWFTYVMFIFGVLVSHGIFIAGVLGLIETEVSGPFMLLWMLAIVAYAVETCICLSIEQTEMNRKNFIAVILMYFTYSQLWLLVVGNSTWHQIRDKVLNQKPQWDKTERVEI